jgi:1,2-diacylglycerol 3-beta-glucosyltransferase
MFNRILLISIILAVWIAIKVVDYLIPGPVLLIVLFLILAMMIVHVAWLNAAQRLWQRKLRKLHGIGAQMSILLEPPHVREQNNEQDDEAWEPAVDLLISAKNESKVIESTVRNLFQIDYPKFNVWVINDNSTDDMPKVLERLQVEFANLHVLHRQPGSYPGKSAALNEALALCRGEVIVVFDADANVAPNFLKLTLPVLQPEHVGAVQAQKRLYEHNKNYLIECQSTEYAVDTFFQMGRDLIGGMVELRGDGQLIKRTALIDVGGWNNKTITDDLDLSMRLLISKWDIRFCPEAVVWEEGVPTIKGLLRQRRRWAEGSIRRYLDYIFPLNAPSRLSLVERLDIFAFVTEFTVPALVCLEVVSEAINLAVGGPIHPKLLLVFFICMGIVSQFNFFSALRLYRSHLSLWEQIRDSWEGSTYALTIWMPCIFYAFWKIMFSKQASTWHRTEHFGQAIPQTEPSVADINSAEEKRN